MEHAYERKQHDRVERMVYCAESNASTTYRIVPTRDRIHKEFANSVRLN